MFSIRRLITSSGSCRAIRNTYSLRCAGFSTSSTIRQEVSDLSSQPMSKTTTAKPLPANYRPLHKLDRSIPKEPFSQLVSLQNLPETATKEDILRLARQAFHDPEAPIKEVLFVRNQELQFNGRVLVVFDNAEDAEHFRLMNDHVVVGGKQVKVNRVDIQNLSSNDLLKGFRKSEMYSTNGKSAAGRTVILSGFPQRTNTAHVSRWLHSKGYYPEDEEENAIVQAPTKQQALVSKFFVRFPSESDAWRAVRRFHNVTFRPNTFNNRYTIKATNYMNPSYSRGQNSENDKPRPLTSSRSQLSPTRTTFPMSNPARSNTANRPAPATLNSQHTSESSSASQIGFSYATVIEPSSGNNNILGASPTYGSPSYNDERPARTSLDLRDRPQPPINQKSSRSSLDMPALWKSMRDSVIQEEKPPPTSMDSTEDYLVQLLVQQSVIDAKDFEVLTLEQVEELKKDHISLTSRIANVTTRLALESKMREAAQSLTHLHSSNRKMAQQAQNQLAAANRQVDHVASELFKLTQSGSNVQRKLLEHMAGALSVGIKRLEMQMSDSQQPNSQGTNQELTSMARKLQERDAAIADRDREIERLRMQLRAQTMDESAEAVIEQRERSIAELRSELEQVTNRLDFITRRESLLSPTESQGRAFPENDHNRSDDQPKDTAAISMQLEKMVSALEDRLVEYRQNATRLEVELEEMEQQRNALQQSAKSYESRPDQTAFETLRLKLEDEQRARSETETKCKELNEKIHVLESLKRESESNGASSDELLKLSAEVEKLERHQRERETELENSLTDARETIQRLKVAQSALAVEIMATNRMSEDDFDLEECRNRIRDLKSQADKVNSDVTSLEKSLSDSKVREELLEREKDSLMQESQRLRTKMSDMEVRSNTSNSVATAASARERSLQMELQRFRAETFELREQKEKWEKTMKRESVFQVVQGGGDVLKAQYEQAMQEQVEEYEAQLKEQSALLDKTLREKDDLESEKQKLTAMSKDLEDLVKEKIRTLDSKEGVIGRLEMELAEVKVRLVESQTSGYSDIDPSVLNELSTLRMENTTMEAELNITQDQLKALQSRFENAQRQFSQVEQELHKRSERLEDDFEGIMKEYERITQNLINLESEKHGYDRRYNEIQQRALQLETELADEKIKTMGIGESNESSTTASLRKEFRRLMNEMKSEHHEVLMREVLERKKLEGTVRDMRRDQELRRWDKVSKGVQTNLVLLA